MIILMKAWTNGACLNEADCAIIHASKGWAKWVLSQIELAERVTDLDYISIFFSSPSWLPFSGDLAGLMDEGILGNDVVGESELERISAELCFLSDSLWLRSFDDDVEFLRVDGETIRVDSKSAYWRTYIKNTDAVATTAEISKELLERIAKGDK